MKKFICVFTEDSRDLLKGAEFFLISSDDYNKIFVFENKDQLSEAQAVALDSVSYILTDTLTF